MDEREPPPGAPVPGDEVGLGRVLENPAGLGRPEPVEADDSAVDEASEDSFPASDPPVFMSDPPTPGTADGDPTGRPSA